jgi:hypothetical protein
MSPSFYHDLTEFRNHVEFDLVLWKELEMTDQNSLQVGSPIVHFNQWTGFENKEVCKFFELMTLDDIAKLSEGDILWVDVDPMHRHGKVYGWVKATLLHKTWADPGYEISWKGGSVSGRYNRLVENTKFYKVKDEAALLAFTKNFPLARIVDERQTV